MLCDLFLKFEEDLLQRKDLGLGELISHFYVDLIQYFNRLYLIEGVK